MSKVKLTINGVQKEIEASPDLVLLDLLREQLGLTGAKQSCDRKGQCGACTVIVDKKAVRSCLTRVVNLEGANVISVEGLGTPENPHLIQEAFVLSGAVQCGFCMPGMIMSAKALLDQNLNPTREEIIKALSRNLCRCTGYVKIFDAVNLAAKFLRGETTPGEVKSNLGTEKIGVSHPRPTNMLKATGLAKYTADIKLDNPVELAVVHSTEFHAKILSIDSAEALKMPGVVGIMTADDIKGTNRIRVFTADQPVLCEDIVRTLGDPIAIVGADTREHARAAAAAVRVEYEKLPVMMNPQESLAEGAYRIHKHSPNLCYEQPLIQGDAETALAKSAAVVEGKFSTQMNHQASLEPEVSIAYFEGDELVVVGRSIQINSSAAQLAEAVGYEKLRYKEPFVGGQFGIKGTITSEGIPAAAVLYFKRAVRYIPSLHESMLISSKRHPFYMDFKLGADADGKLTGMYNHFEVDKGAYFLLGPVVPMRGLHMINGSYRIPNIDAYARLAYTNNASGGAARGAGPPQVAFPLEVAMDMLAEKLGIDPLEFRKKNSMKAGEPGPTGQIAEQWPFPELCDAIRPAYDRAKKTADDNKNGTIKRGVGLAANSFGIAEAGDASKLFVEMDPDDGITIYAAVADPGEGNDSMLTQIGAYLMDIPLDKVRLYTRDTDKTVEMGPSAGSRMTYMAGGALIDAINSLKKALKEAGTNTYEGLTLAGKPTRFEGNMHIAGDGKMDPKTGAGGTFDSQVHNIQMAEVEVNTETGEVKVVKMTSAVDAGTILHPQNFQGQIEGGMDQGVGWALREEYILGQTKDWRTFKFPTFQTAIPMELITREEPRLRGPLGATGIGEMTMVSTAPAVINAIHDACGIWIQDLPATPEKIKAALAAAGK